MSVNWGCIHATPMPTAVTQLEATTVHVSMALREMESTALVCMIKYNLLPRQHLRIIFLSYSDVAYR